jgi:hypothetical protein
MVSGVKFLSNLLRGWLSSRMVLASPVSAVGGRLDQTPAVAMAAAELPQRNQDRENCLPEPLASQTPVTQFVEDMLLPATTVPLVIRDQFKRPARIKYATVWEGFKTRFLGKTEAGSRFLGLPARRLH